MNNLTNNKNQKKSAKIPLVVFLPWQISKNPMKTADPSRSRRRLTIFFDPLLYFRAIPKPVPAELPFHQHEPPSCSQRPGFPRCLSPSRTAGLTLPKPWKKVCSWCIWDHSSPSRDYNTCRPKAQQTVSSAFQPYHVTTCRHICIDEVPPGPSSSLLKVSSHTAPLVLHL